MSGLGYLGFRVFRVCRVKGIGYLGFSALRCMTIRAPK